MLFLHLMLVLMEKRVIFIVIFDFHLIVAVYECCLLCFVFLKCLVFSWFGNKKIGKWSKVFRSLSGFLYSRSHFSLTFLSDLN